MMIDKNAVEPEDFQKPSRKGFNGKKKNFREKSERIVPDEKIYKREKFTARVAEQYMDEDEYEGL